MKSIVWASLCAALLGGGIVALLQRPARAFKPTEASRQQETTGASAPTLSDFEARIARLENRAITPAPAPSAPARDATPSLAPELSPQAAAAQNHERHRAAIADHDREPLDPKWAPTTKRAFEDDLAKFAGEANFEVARVDCRTTTCVADITFGSYGSAMGNWRQLLMGRYSTNCGREVLLDDAPPDGAAKFSTTVFFDCLSSRTE